MHLVGHHPCPCCDHVEGRHVSSDLDSQARALFEVVTGGAESKEMRLNKANSRTLSSIVRVRALIFVLFWAIALAVDTQNRRNLLASNYCLK